MHEVCKLKMKNNKGIATVEMCVVVPLVLWICVNIIFVYLDVIGDGVSQGECYFEIYTFSEDKRQQEGEFAQAVIKKDHNLLCKGKQYADEGVDYLYKGNPNTYKTEYDMCTMRLRRWQLYGTVLQE